MLIYNHYSLIEKEYNLIMLFINFYNMGGSSGALLHAFRSVPMMHNYFLDEHVAKFGWRYK